MSVKMKKGGQFYLVAAMIIAVIIFGVVSVSNYARQEKKDTTVSEAGSEIDTETGRVVDYAIVNNKEVSGVISNWTETYVLANEGEDIESWVFVYGNSTNSSVLAFSKVGSGVISINGGSGNSFKVLTKKTNRTERWFNQETIDFQISEERFSFELSGGKNFVFLIKKGGYVERSEK